VYILLVLLHYMVRHSLTLSNKLSQKTILGNWKLL